MEGSRTNCTEARGGDWADSSREGNPSQNPALCLVLGTPAQVLRGPSRLLPTPPLSGRGRFSQGQLSRARGTWCAPGGPGGSPQTLQASAKARSSGLLSLPTKEGAAATLEGQTGIGGEKTK